MVSELSTKQDFKKLYTVYYGVMVNFAFSKTRDRELSYEIVQNTFVKLWMRREHTEINNSIKSYLFMMVKNAIIDHYRQNEKFSELEQFPDNSDEDSRENDDEEVILYRYIIKKALAQMKPKRKLIFELSKYEGLTYAEIAEHLHISERAVEDNIAKAIIMIREMLNVYKSSPL